MRARERYAGLFYFKFEARPGVRELIASCVPPMEAGELASLYPFKFSDLMDMARDFRAS